MMVDLSVDVVVTRKNSDNWDECNCHPWTVMVHLRGVVVVTRELLQCTWLSGIAPLHCHQLIV